MHRALLTDLQRRRCYPSVTVLINTSPGRVLGADQISAARDLIARADGRLRGDVDDPVRVAVVAETIELVLLHGGRAVIVDDGDDGDLGDHERMAAILRY